MSKCIRVGISISTYKIVEAISPALSTDIERELYRIAHSQIRTIDALRQKLRERGEKMSEMQAEVDETAKEYRDQIIANTKAEKVLRTEKMSKAVAEKLKAELLKCRTNPFAIIDSMTAEE